MVVSLFSLPPAAGTDNVSRIGSRHARFGAFAGQRFALPGEILLAVEAGDDATVLVENAVEHRRRLDVEDHHAPCARSRRRATWRRAGTRAPDSATSRSPIACSRSRSGGSRTRWPRTFPRTRRGSDSRSRCAAFAPTGRTRPSPARHRGRRIRLGRDPSSPPARAVYGCRIPPHRPLEGCRHGPLRLPAGSRSRCRFPRHRPESRIGWVPPRAGLPAPRVRSASARLGPAWFPLRSPCPSGCAALRGWAVPCPKARPSPPGWRG